MMTCLQAVGRKAHKLSLIWTEEAVRPREGVRVRGFQNLGQLETCHLCLSPDADSLAVKDNKFFNGTTCGTVLQPIGALPEKDEWRLSVAAKREYWGKDACPDSEDPKPLPPKRVYYPPRNDSDIEPVSFWQMPPEVYGEVLWRLNARAVIDCTPTDVLPLYCLENSIYYVGLMFTNPAVDALKRRLASAVFEKFLDEKSPIYKPELATVVDTIRRPAEEPRAKAKGKAKPRAKAQAREGGSEDNPGSGADDGGMDDGLDDPAFD